MFVLYVLITRAGIERRPGPTPATAGSQSGIISEVASHGNRRGLPDVRGAYWSGYRLSPTASRSFEKT